MAGLLEGLRMVEWGQFHNGVAAGYMLGDLGMEVIKIEHPIRGDAGRGMTQLHGDIMTVKGRNILFEAWNRGKKGITLNLQTEKGKEVLFRLIAQSDVFLTNFRRSLLKRLGVDYETMRQHNPRLIYAIATAFGSRGPEGDKRGFDTTGMARSGVMWLMGDRDQEEPVQVVGGIFDQMGATMTAWGILAALVRRERTGEGEELETSILGGAIHLIASAVYAQTFRGRAHARHSRSRARNPMANHYRCADGEWIMLAEPQSDRYWEEFCHLLGLQEIQSDPRFNTAMARRENYAEMNAIIARALESKPREHWLKTFEAAKVGFAHAPILRVSDLPQDTQVLANDYLVDIDHPVLGPVKVLGLPIQFKNHPAKVGSPAPEFGQHTEEVLRELCGYSWEDIAQMREQGVI